MFGFGSTPDTPAPPVDYIPGTGPLKALLRTSMGDIEVELLEKEAPRTVANFVGLATGRVEWTGPSGRKSTTPLYNGTIFHRVIPNFMIQGGDPAGDGRGGPGFRWKDEASALRVRHDRGGLLSMANAGPNTNGSQFFIISGPSGVQLPPAYALFGQVVKGLDIVDQMQQVPTLPGDRPKDDVVIRSVTINVAD